MSMKTNEESREFKYSVALTECEVIEKDDNNKPTKARIGGICLVPTVSRNGNKYTINNVTENDKKVVKFFAQDHGVLQYKNVVGKMSLTESDGKLRYDGEIRNTVDHPDIVEHAINKEIDVSIDARASGKKIEENEGKKVYSWGKVDIRALCGVGIGGLAENSMEYAIAESFNETEEIIEDEQITEKVNNMDELETMKSKIAEMENLIKEKDEALRVKEAEEEARAEEEKAEVIEEIKAANSEVKESELKGKSISELKTILSYEKKLKESEEESEEDEEGNGEVEGDENDAPAESEKSGVLVNESEDTITMNEAMRREIYKCDPACE